MTEEQADRLTFPLGMRAVWKRNERWLRPAHIVPTAAITHLRELLPLFRQWKEDETAGQIAR